MKKLLCLLLSITLLSISVSAAADKKEFKISTPNGFVSATSSSDMTELAAVFSTTPEELKGYFEEHNILYIAASADYSEQIYLTAEQTDFSEKTVSFSRIEREELEEIAKSLAGKTFENGGIVKGKNDVPFIKLILHTDDGYDVYEFLTVCSSKLYTLRISTNDNPEKLFKGFFKTLTIDDCATLENRTNQSLYTVLAAAGIAVFVAVAAVVGFTVIRDIKSRREDEKNTESDNNN